MPIDPQDRVEDSFDAMAADIRSRIDNGEVSGPLHMIESARKVIDRQKDKELFLRTLLLESEALTGGSRWDEVLVVLDDAAGYIAENEELSPHLPEVQFGIGNALSRIGDYERSIPMFEHCIQSSGDDTEISAMAYNKMGAAYVSLGEFNKGIEQFMKATTIFKELGLLRDLPTVLNSIADAYLKKEDFKTALAYSEQVIRLAKEFDQVTILGFGYMNAATGALRMGSPETAMGHLQNAKEIFADHEDTYVRGSLYGLEGYIETGRGNYDKAEEAYEIAIDLLKESDVRYYLAMAYHEYGSLQERKDAKSWAMDLYEMALDIYEMDGCTRECEHLKKHIKNLEF